MIAVLLEVIQLYLHHEGRCRLGPVRGMQQRSLSALNISVCHVFNPNFTLGIFRLPGVTLQASSVRRRPNAFNYVHQMEALLRIGSSSEAAMNGLQASGSLDFGAF